MVNNFIDDAAFDKRTHLQIWVSKDGVNWIKKIKLEDDDAYFFYPHAYDDNKEQILYVAYENSKQFYLQKIPYDDIKLKGSDTNG